MMALSPWTNPWTGPRARLGPGVSRAKERAEDGWREKGRTEALKAGP